VFETKRGGKTKHEGSGYGIGNNDLKCRGELVLAS
jgi:hypothetical protein